MYKNCNIENLLKLASKEIELPNIQRGFVWKPFQIENLLDSLLRGYPIGAFTIQEKQSKIRLLDGQQRLSALAITFSINNETFKMKNSDYRVFIDLYKPSSENNNEHLYKFRVITRFHPWGYQFDDNSDKLSSKYIHEALNLFNIEEDDKYNGNYMKELQKSCYPYDSYLPVPFDCFLTDDKQVNHNIDCVKARIKKWIKCTKQQEIFNAILSSDIKECVCKKLNNMSKEGPSINIPTLKLREYKKSLENKKSKPKDIQFYSIDDIVRNLKSSLKQEIALISINTDNVPDIDNVFERLNRGGTAVTNEELNYSLFKSKIENKYSSEIATFEKTINKSYPFISPARFLPIMVRLYAHASKKDKKAVISNSIRISSKDFKKDVLDNDCDNLIDFININTKKLLDDYKTTMLYNSESNKKGIPYPLLVQLTNEAPELLYMHLYRKVIAGDNNKVNKNLKLALVLVLYWFYGGEKTKNYPRLLNNIFPAMQQLDEKRFYSSEILHRATLNLNEYYNPIITEDDIETLENSNNKIINNRDFLLYAQRNALDKWFSEDSFNAQDTDRPFDYDHIMPHNWIKRGGFKSIRLKEIYHTNGNMRAWPFWLNRQDKDDSPKTKLYDVKIRNNSFCSGDWKMYDSIFFEKNKKYKGNTGKIPEAIKIIKERNKEIYLEAFNNLLKNFIINEDDIIDIEKSTCKNHITDDNSSECIFGKYKNDTIFSLSYPKVYGNTKFDLLSILEEESTLWIPKYLISNIENLAQETDFTKDIDYVYYDIILPSLSKKSIDDIKKTINEQLQLLKDKGFLTDDRLQIIADFKKYKPDSK